jgi:hypothetical protein
MNGEIDLTTKYIVYNHNGGGVRHHHFGTQNNIIDESDGRLSPGNTHYAHGFDTLFYHGVNVPFAFMSVHGAADGNHLYTTPGIQSVIVGSNNIDILVVYAPPDGIGSDGGPGIWVDAFDVDTGNFSDSLDFVKILTPPTPPDTVDAAKTTYSNQEGDVSTLTAENVRANNNVDSVPFLEWKKIVPSPLIVKTTEIDLTRNETGEIWFAFYMTPSSPSTQPRISKKLDETIAAMEQGIFVWTGDPYCGNGGHWIGPGHGPGPGPSPFKIVLEKEVISRVNSKQETKLKTLASQYPKIAGTAFISITKVLTILKEINDAVSGEKGNKSNPLSSQ